MKLSKIKIIAIAIFLLINAVLIGAYIINNKSSRSVRAEVMAEVGEILAAKNISVTADKFPIIPSNLPTYMSINAFGSKETIAAHLLGSDNFMSEPNRFLNDDASVVINGGHFIYRPLKLDEDDLKSLGKPQNFWAKRRAKAEIKAASLWSGKTKFMSSQKDKDSEQAIFKLYEVLGDYPVVDSGLVVWAGASESKEIADRTLITRIDGYNWLNTTYKKIPDSQARLKTLAEILIDCANSHNANNPLVITNIEFGYIAGERVPDIIEKELDIGIKISYDGGAFCLSAIK